MNKLIVFGSARLSRDSYEYAQTYKLVKTLVRENSWIDSVLTGGGPSLMEAANKAAMDCKVKSVGVSVDFLNGEKSNLFMHEEVSTSAFLERWHHIFPDNSLFLIVPGGIGTLTELCIVLQYLQTEELTNSRVVMVGRQLWSPLLPLLNEMIRFGTMSAKDIYTEHRLSLVDFDEVPDLVREFYSPSHLKEVPPYQE